MKKLPIVAALLLVSAICSAQTLVQGVIVQNQSVVTFSATPTFNAESGNAFKLTLTGNVTSSTLTKARAGQLLSFEICQDGTGGRTFVPPTNVQGWVTISSTASVCTQELFVYDGTNAQPDVIGIVSGVSFPSGPSTHQTPIVTAANTVTYKTVPDCQDTAGNHLNYTQSSDAYSCGTTHSAEGKQIFTSGGTFTIPAGVTAVKVTVVGAGGAGGGAAVGNAGGGGGGGATAVKWLTGLTPGNTITVTVGTGGTGVSGANGNAGGNSSISSGTQTITTVTANGGGGGFGTIGVGNGGGSASSGDVNIQGSAGANSIGTAGSGPGGPSTMGGGGAPSGGGVGNTGGSFGGGGSGAINGAAAGGAGANGIVIFEW